MPKFETKNEFLIGSAAGTLATIPKYLFHEVVQLLGLTRFDNNWTAFYSISQDYSHTPLNVIISIITAIIIGAIFGVVFAFLTSKVMTSHLYLLKGAFYGTAIWFINLGIFSPVFFKTPFALTKDIPMTIALLIGLMLYGFLTAYFLQRFGIFDEEQGLW